MAQNTRSSLPAACGLLLIALSGAAEAVTLTRGPYLGRPTDSAVAVSWSTDFESDSRVDYAREEGAWSTIQQREATRKHVVVLDDLASGEIYRYRVYSDGAPLADESFFRAPRGPIEDRFRFAIIGDTNGVAIPSRIADRLVESDVDFALHTGDVVYPSGAEKDYDAEFFLPFSRWLRQGPVLPTLGNHDIVTERGAPLLDNFVLPVNDATRESRFYSFRHANAFFICLDVEGSAFGAGSVQYEWLVRALQESSAVWKFVYFHSPAYSSAHPNRLVQLILSPLFERFGVDVVFSGHEHLYERTYPIRDFVPSGPGVVYITEGGGGASPTKFHPETYSAFVTSRYGYTEVEIDGSRLSLSARDLEGFTLDSLVINKDGALPRRAPIVFPSKGQPASRRLVRE